MSQHVSLKDLIIGIRFRLSDPDLGTLGNYRYAGYAEDTDEMKFVANESQRAATILCCSPTTALLRSVNERQRVVSGTTTYALKDDYLDRDFIDYYKGEKKYPVYQRDMQNFPPNEESERVRGFSDGIARYRYYDIYGQGSPEKVVGIIRQDSLNEVHDIYNNFDNIRAGDIIDNVSDRSQAVVVEVNRPDNPAESDYLTIDSLKGGSANRFSQGDEYKISSPEALNELLHVYPKLKFNNNSRKIYSESTATFQTNEAFLLEAVDVYINTVPTEIEPDDRMVVEILQGNQLVSRDPASVTSNVGVKKGYNRFDFDEVSFPEGIRIAEDTEYTVRATVGTTPLDVTALDIYAYGTTDYLSLNYSRLPRKMVNDYDICEIPPWALELLYAMSIMIAEQKISGNPEPNPGLMNNVMFWKDKIEDKLWKRAERGVSYLDEGAYPYRRENEQGFLFADDVIG